MGLYVTDHELYEYLGVPAETGRIAIAALDKDPHGTFPKKQELWGGRRYLPAVQAWLDRQNGLKMDAPQQRRAS